MIFRKAEKERMKTIYCKQRNMLYRAAILRLQKIPEHKKIQLAIIEFSC